MKLSNQTITDVELDDVAPGCSEPPSASTGDMSAHTSTPERTSLLNINVSPKVMSGGGRVLARDVNYTPDLHIFTSLVRTGQLTEATQLCNERLLNAPNDLTVLRWTKEASIVKRVEGKYADSLTLLAAVYRLAAKTEGITRGRYENSLGRSHELTGNYDLALEHYRLARHFHTEPIHVAQVENNLGRLLTAMSSPQDAYRHFDAAILTAHRYGDVLLKAEALESRALALESEGKFIEAAQSVLASIALLESSGEEMAMLESKETHLRIIERMKA